MPKPNQWKKNDNLGLVSFDFPALNSFSTPCREPHSLTLFYKIFQAEIGCFAVLEQVTSAQPFTRNIHTHAHLSARPETAHSER